MEAETHFRLLSAALLKRSSVSLDRFLTPPSAFVRMGEPMRQLVNRAINWYYAQRIAPQED